MHITLSSSGSTFPHNTSKKTSQEEKTSQDKKPQSCPNYRSISLLKVVLKIFTHALSNHLFPFLPSLLSLFQVGFVPGREAKDNTILAMNVVHWLLGEGQPNILLLTDMEKELDRVSGMLSAAPAAARPGYTLLCSKNTEVTFVQWFTHVWLWHKCPQHSSRSLKLTCITTASDTG